MKQNEMYVCMFVVVVHFAYQVSPEVVIVINEITVSRRR
jgi:hypothetical protein